MWLKASPSQNQRQLPFWCCGTTHLGYLISNTPADTVCCPCRCRCLIPASHTNTHSCLTAGTCVNICARPDIKAVVEDSARRYRPCANATTCAAGEECRQPQFACTMVQCTPLALSQGVEPVQFVPCPKICMAEAPKMLNASFSDSGTKIQVSVGLSVVCAKGTKGA